MKRPAEGGSSTMPEKKKVDEDGFTLVEPRHRVRPRPVSAAEPVSTSQRFAPLANLQQEEASAPVGAKRPPPIVITPPRSSEDLKALLLREGISAFHIFNGPKETRIYPHSEEVQGKIFLLLQRSDVFFHTFFRKTEKPNRKYLLHGFDIDADIQQIARDLQDRLPGFLNARRLRKVDSSGKRTDITAILVTTEHKTKVSDLKKLRSINFTSFRVSVFRDGDGAVQCFNCQRFGHIQSACHHPFRCVRCGGNHDVRSCQRETQKVCCVNCGGDHVASYRSCPHRVAILKKRAETSKIPPAKTSTSQPSKNSSTGNTQGIAGKKVPNVWDSRAFPSLPSVPGVVPQVTGPTGSEPLSIPQWAQPMYLMLTQMFNMFQVMLANGGQVPNHG